MPFSGPVWKVFHFEAEVTSFEKKKEICVEQKRKDASGLRTDGITLAVTWVGLNSIKGNLITEMSKNLIRRQSRLCDPLTRTSRTMHGMCQDV